MDYPDIFLVTSVINTGNNKWSYSNIRSIYNCQERYEQTLETIESIRKYTRNSIILLAECSDLSQEMRAELEHSVDIFLYQGEVVRKICMETDKKGFGEATQTENAIDWIKKKNIPFRRLFKISGRYHLKSSFDISLFSDEVYSFKVPHPGTESYSTVLYSVPFCLFDHYINTIKTCCAEYEASNYPIGYECLLPPQCNPKKLIPTLHVSGKVAITPNEIFHC